MRNHVPLVLCLMAVATIAAGDDPAPAPAAAAPSALQFDVESLAGTVSTPGGHQFSVGARATVSFRVSPHLLLFSRVDGWRQGDGQAADLPPSAWSTFEAVELHGGGDAEISPNLAVFGAFGQGAPLTSVKIAEPHPITLVGGIRLGRMATGHMLRIGAGEYSAIGRGLKAVMTARMRLADHTAAICEAAWSPGRSGATDGSPQWIVRSAIAVGVKP